MQSELLLYTKTLENRGLSLPGRSLVVQKGKGDKDRVVPLSVPLIPELRLAYHQPRNRQG